MPGDYKSKTGGCSIDIKSGLLARNTLLNLMGQVIPIIVGVAAIPFLTRGLGPDRFGLLSIAWVILGYFTFFDLGLGRATTKFVSEAIGKGDKDQIPRVVWTAVTAEAFFGLVGAAVLAFITPLLVGRVLSIPQELISEAKATFYLLALSVPVVLISSSFRGVLSAAQRFDLVNTVKIPISCASYLLPLLGLALGFNLPGIVALVLFARFGGLAAYVMLTLRTITKLKTYSSSLAVFPKLFVFGGWVMLSSVISPILVYFERFLIGSFLSMAALAYYSAPSEMVTRLSIIPTSLAMTLFPAFSFLEEVQNRQKLAAVFIRSVKYVMLTVGPILIAIWLFAEDILRLWLGIDFAKEGSVVLQLLTIGVLFNSLAHIPYSLLQGIGRPDLPAKLHIIEMPIFIVTAWVLVGKLGIVGAAMAWTIRMTLDALLLFVTSFKICKFPAAIIKQSGLISVGIIFCILAGVTSLINAFADSLSILAQGILFIVSLCMFGWFVWNRVIDYKEKGIILDILKRIKRLEGISQP